METSYPVVIIGAGMAGLTCAHYLNQAGIACLVLEAADAVGGRIRTDLVDGFRLDRGFQILITAYPETRRLLDYPALQLGKFRSGAAIRYDNDFMEVADPRRDPEFIWESIKAPIGSLADKLRLVKLVKDIVGTDTTTQDFFREEGPSTLDYLKEQGLSDQMIDTFFRPFFGGIFLEDGLVTSSNFFRFVFRQFYDGEAALPATGMQAIPEQVAARLPTGSVRLNTRVRGIDGQMVYLDNGDAIRAEQVVLATDARSADHLLGQPTDRQFNTTTCTYFAADRSPHSQRLLLLNPAVDSAVHHVAVLSDVVPSYAPAGKALISVSTQVPGRPDQEVSEAAIRQVLRGWFGDEVLQWQYLKTYYVKDALVRYGAGSQPVELRVREGLYRCGDYTAYPSLNAAMLTGRQVAEMIVTG
ncbi:NAD(P)/FAD-dependent oxidoreductase [Telluribacter sp. SYSU D00476]|uniref:protoporphyrinogen/coproporphyrinogen oxidase n=1 Tax=Telluribacter sp. SYSU D00476 TaxID=2811430 RepID=UPI001FF61FC2|nr:NAD(P)/FAD-dependent oxidoreductase [Telluribacter sp. SYSU D00476]